MTPDPWLRSDAFAIPAVPHERPAFIRGYKPNGYYVTATAEGVKVEGETRQCVHCQKFWEYHPGSGIVRGWCLRCNGILCNEPACAAEQQRLLAHFPNLGTKACIPYTDANKRLRDQYAHDPRYEVLPSGIVIARA